MKVSFQQNNRVSFKRAFTTDERKKADALQKDAKKVLDIDKVMIITPEPSLPAGKFDTGIGQLNSETSTKFYEFMKSYAGINSIKFLPPGEIRPRNGFYCSYGASSLSLGTHSINLQELTTEEFGKILSAKTFKNAVLEDANTSVVNYENAIGRLSSQHLALEEAFKNFKNSNHPKVLELKEEFSRYKQQNAEVIEKKALYEILQNQNRGDEFYKWISPTHRELFNPDVVPLEKREKIIAQLKENNADNIEFAYFKQFLAEKNLEKAGKNLNSKDLKLFGDCLIGFSKDEIWAHPNAFEKDAFIGSSSWGLRSLNFANITDENSESFKLLKQKVEYFAKRYDGIRFDVGWAYAEPIVYAQNHDLLKDRYDYDHEIGAFRLKNKLGSQLLEKIENIVKGVKGQDFDTKNLIYEIEAGVKEFTPFDWNKFELKDEFKNRTIVQSTCYLSEDYATVDMLENKMKVPRDNYVYMVGNHDHISLNALAHGIDNDNMLKRNGNYISQMLPNQRKALSKELNIGEEMIKSSPTEFVKAKFAQLFLAKNIKMFFLDIFGSKEQFDSQGANSSKNYRQRIPANYEQEFHKALQNDSGFNLFGSMAKAMKAKGLAEENKTLYDELVRCAEILREKGALSEAEANKLFNKTIETKTSSPRTKLLLLLAGVLVVGAGIWASTRNSAR